MDQAINLSALDRWQKDSFKSKNLFAIFHLVFFQYQFNFCFPFLNWQHRGKSVMFKIGLCAGEGEECEALSLF